MPRSYIYGLTFLLTLWASTAEAGDLVEDSYSDKLTRPGYHRIVTIPKGSTEINVTEVAKTGNYLTVKEEDGRYPFNANSRISSSGKYSGAGTYFIYLRPSRDQSQNFYSPGPLNTTVHVELIYQKYRPKILYRYRLPDEIKPTTAYSLDTEISRSTDVETLPTAYALSTNSANIMLGDEIKSSTTPATATKRRRRAKFTWRAVGFDKCSKTCGGGYQSKRYICSRLRHLKQVSSKKCESLKKPKAVSIGCNSNPCPAQWQAGDWGRCSVSCGNGTRSRELRCVQEMANDRKFTVDALNCPAQPSAVAVKLQEACHMPDCSFYATTSVRTAPAEWKAEQWSACSASCGEGTRTRKVACISDGQPCAPAEKPASEEACVEVACSAKSLITGNDIPESSTAADNVWLYSDWPEQCPTKCGVATVTRRLYCESMLVNESCDEKKMPGMNKTCSGSGNDVCGQWFTGPWSDCSSDCETGIKSRDVMCLVSLLGFWKVVDRENCEHEMPETVQFCEGPACGATWFMSDWSECSASCDGGTQSREVKCIGRDGRPITSPGERCDEWRKPMGERSCNESPCSVESNLVDNSVQNGDDDDDDAEQRCRDALPNCASIRSKSKQSKHKCQMKKYAKGCCKACRYFRSIANLF